MKGGEDVAASDELAPLLRAVVATAWQPKVQQAGREVQALLANPAGGRSPPAGSVDVWLAWLLAALVIAAVSAAAIYRARQRVFYRLERVIEIESTPGRLFEQLHDLRNWPCWSTVLAFSPAVERRFAGPEQAPGSVCDWTNSRRQRGRIKVDISEGADRLVVTSTRAGAPSVRDLLTFRLAPAGLDGVTRVHCVSHGQAPWLARVLDPVLPVEARKGRQLDAELAALKRAAEAAMITA